MCGRGSQVLSLDEPHNHSTFIALLATVCTSLQYNINFATTWNLSVIKMLYIIATKRLSRMTFHLECGSLSTPNGAVQVNSVSISTTMYLEGETITFSCTSCIEEIAGDLVTTCQGGSYTPVIANDCTQNS